MCLFKQPKPPKPHEPRPADELADEAISGNRLAAAGAARDATRLTQPLGLQTAPNTTATKTLLG
jgi:hypothetical protein